MILVDAHVHLYDCFDLQVFFDSALANFKFKARRFGQADSFTGVLLLAETSKDNWFHRLAGYADRGGPTPNRAVKNWTFQRTNEDYSLYAQNSSEQGVFLIAGRQIVTAEHLEVLALATDKLFVDGIPLADTIQAVKNSGGLPVVPWGFGKWFGKRGAILEDSLVEKHEPWFLGDNGGRPFFWPRPKLFEVAEAFGGQVLPGSDPLPFPSELRKVGRFGFMVKCPLDPEQPAASLKRILHDSTVRLMPYGSLENSLHFVRIQCAMLLRKYCHFKSNLQII